MLLMMTKHTHLLLLKHLFLSRKYVSVVSQTLLYSQPIAEMALLLIETFVYCIYLSIRMDRTRYI